MKAIAEFLKVSDLPDLDVFFMPRDKRVDCLLVNPLALDYLPLVRVLSVPCTIVI